MLDTFAFVPYTAVSQINSSAQYPYGYNGKTKDNEWSGIGNHLDFGARGYDSRITRFGSLDRFADKYPNQSPYCYAANSPIGAVDINGDYVYILAYTKGQEKNEYFEASVLTRKYDIEHSPGFDPTRDKVEPIEVTDLAKIKNQIQSVINKDQEQYGKTIEFGIWSHGGFDGPAGTVFTSSDKYGDGSQMHPRGWGKINFNWAESGAKAGFYGCNGAGGETPWIKDISLMNNFKNVEVWGQPFGSYPSLYADYKNNFGRNGRGDLDILKPRYETFYQSSGLDNFVFPPIISIKDYYINKTYLVAGKQYRGSISDAQLMSRYKNGQKLPSTFQPGDKKTN